MRWAVFAALALVAVTSLLPLLETNAWWVRVFDFPRIQMLVALAVVGPLYLLFRPGWSLAAGAAVLLWAAAVSYHLYKIAPFLPVADEQTVAVADCPADASIRVLVANVERSNRNAQALFSVVRSSQPDLFLAMETDQWWDAALQDLQPLFQAHVQQIARAKSHFGIHLFSQLPIRDGEVRFLLDNGVPSVFVTGLLPDGSEIDFYGLHPTPPRLFDSSLDRDAQLVLAALEARESGNPVVLAGDLNAVPWERTFRRMLRIGRLLDPRVGRGLYNTYPAQTWGMAWPLDHVLWQEQFGLVSVRRMPGIGSDHYPWLAELCHDPEARRQQAGPALEPGDLEEASRTITLAEGR